MDIREEIKGLDTDHAIIRLTEIIDSAPDCEEAYILRGLKNWSAGNRAAAITDYLSAIRINPESRAREALRAVNEILDYRNKDLLNP